MKKPFVSMLMVAAAVGLPALVAKRQADAQAEKFRSKLSGDQKIVHALSRITYGAQPGDFERIKKLGLKKWIEQQLTPEKITENPHLEARLRPLETIGMTTDQVVAEYPAPQMLRALASGMAKLPDDPEKRATLQRLAARYMQRIEAKKGVGEPVRPRALAEGRRRQAMEFGSVEDRRRMIYNTAPLQVVAHDLFEAKIYRAVYSNRQLAEVLSDFWFNHFNVFLDKGADRYLVTEYEREAIRPHVLGKFRDLLRATAASPAMLFYLDNWQSVDPNARRGRPLRGRARGLNENYARELLELHTLGVDGGYTQKDIVEVARCFTGWTLRDPRSGGFQFNARTHDQGEKTVLGVKIPAGGGQQDGYLVLDLLLKHPSTAKFISRKLAQRFVADNPPQALVDRMADTFRKTEGDIREVLRTLLDSREFWSHGAYRSKMKSPLEMVASAVRATGAEVRFAFGLANQVGQLGQPLYRKQEPTGYSNSSEEWVNSAALLARMNFALALAQNKLPGVKIDPSFAAGDPATVAKKLLTEVSSQTRTAIEKGLKDAEANGAERSAGLIAGLVIGSPEFQRR